MNGIEEGVLTEFGISKTEMDTVEFILDSNVLKDELVGAESKERRKFALYILGASLIFSLALVILASFFEKSDEQNKSDSSLGYQYAKIESKYGTEVADQVFVVVNNKLNNQDQLILELNK